MDFGFTIHDATAAPRLHVVPEEGDLHIESRPPPRAVLRGLEQRGFQLSIPISSLFRGSLNPYFGGVHAIALESDGTWRGAADPRRDKTVAYAGSR